MSKPKKGKKKGRTEEKKERKKERKRERERERKRERKKENNLKKGKGGNMYHLRTLLSQFRDQVYCKIVFGLFGFKWNKL